MRKKLLIASVLVLTLGLSFAVYAKGLYRLEAFASLPKDKQELLISKMKSMHDGKAEFREEMKAARKDMYDALTAPKFDEAKFQKSVAKLEKLQEQRMEKFTQTVKELAPQFTQEERQALVKIFPMGRHGHGHHKGNCQK